MYQWQKDGVNLAGKTAMTLSQNAVQTASAGAYRVIVSNSHGSVIIFGRMGDCYRIEYANTLNSPTWAPAATITLPASPHRWFDIDSPNHPMRHYRAILVP